MIVGGILEFDTIPILNPATGTAHDFTSLTDAINLRPRQPGQLGVPIPVDYQSVTQPSALIDREGFEIDILDPTAYNAPPPSRNVASTTFTPRCKQVLILIGELV